MIVTVFLQKESSSYCFVYNKTIRAQQPMLVQDQTKSILISCPTHLQNLYGYNDGVTTCGEGFKMYTHVDADLYFEKNILIFEKFAEPFFKQIQTVEDVDTWYNQGVYADDETAINVFSNPRNYDDWWKGLIASRLAKNPQYPKLEALISSWILYPSIREEFDTIINYFKENNL